MLVRTPPEDNALAPTATRAVVLFHHRDSHNHAGSDSNFVCYMLRTSDSEIRMDSAILNEVTNSLKVIFTV